MMKEIRSFLAEHSWALWWGFISYPLLHKGCFDWEWWVVFVPMVILVEVKKNNE